MKTAPATQPGSDEMLRSMRSGGVARVGEGGLEGLHVACTGMAALLALATAFWRLGLLGAGLSAALGFFCFLGLVLGRSWRLVLSDFYRQFQYREKFALFLGHAALLAVVFLLTGGLTWALPMGALLVVLCFQGIDPVFFGRIHATAMLLTLFGIWKGGFGNAMPPAGLVGGFFLFLLLAIRFGHLRFRLEAEGEGHMLELRELARRSLVPVLVPVASGLAVYAISAQFLFPREWTYRLDPGAIPVAPPMPRTVGQYFWTAIGTVAVIVGCLVTLAWLEKQLRGKGKGTAPEAEAIASTARQVQDEMPAAERAAEEKAAGPRERVLQAFRRYARLRARAEGETAEAFLGRALAGVPEAAGLVEIFNEACYDRRPITDEEAERFVQGLAAGG